ncbi:Fc.00g108780.m01.CDS01 [Cosmosporella sp. VM-42]
MSDEVSQFLEQVERLRGQQIEEDEVRARELEEYLAAKRERQARREERARSISPQKSSPANTPSPRSSRRSVHLSEALKLESPAASKEEPPEPSREPEADPDKADEDAMALPNKEAEDVDPKPTTPGKTPALSWQRRPSSRSGGRPLSMVAAQNATQRSLKGSQEPASATEQSFSKDQIAQALGSKDPSWFRQTADRGANSAAYRKNQVEDEDRSDMASSKAQLPGMSNNTLKEPPAESPKESPAVLMPPPESVVSTPTRTRLASPPTLNPPKFDSPADDKPVGTPGRTPSGRTSPLRSTSPTKGVGGFVQSAMMKRSDSVKRWSVTSPPGLARVDSVASSRSGASRPRSMTRPGSTTPSSSRPTSRHGEADAEGDATPRAPTIDTALDSTPKADDAHMPVSPTKTMDPRRWSPTKSSWLESALNKPESPKPLHKSNSSQPAWMAELNKSKADKAGTGTELGRSRPDSISHKHQVSIGGLMRSTPMGSTAKVNTTGLGGIYSPPPGGNRPAFGHGQTPSLSMSKSAPPKVESTEPEEKPEDPVPETESEPESVEEKSEPEEPEKQEPAPAAKAISPPTTKPKPETPPKKDFRSSLKHRPTGSDANKGKEPEFKNVFGNLRRTRTQNYVAPDPLKDNILRGKASLNQTGGPKRSERVDEFKEAILKKKDDFKKVQSEGKGMSGISRTSTMPVEKPLPEGLARRAELGRPLSSKRDSEPEIKPAVQPKKPESPKPEGLARRSELGRSLPLKRDSASETESLTHSKKPESPKPVPGPKRVPSQTLPSPMSLATSSTTKPAVVDEPKRVSAEPSTKPAAEPRPLSGLNAAFKTQGRVGGRLADRFNPALAGMLSRGPPPMATNGGQSPEESVSKGRSGAGSSEPATEPTAPGPQLTHMTKGRARGPRRKAPTTAATPAASTKTPVAETRSLPEPPRPLPVEPAKPKPSTPPAIETKDESSEEEVAPAPLSIQQQVATKASIRSKPSPIRPVEKAPETFKAPEQSTPSFRRMQSRSPVKEDADIPSPLKIQKTGDAASQPSSPRKLDLKRVSKFMAEGTSESPKPEPAREPVRLTHQRTGSRSPVKMFSRPLPEPEPSSPTKVDRDPVVSVKNAAAIFGGASAKSPPPPMKPSFDGPAPEIETPKAPRASSRPLPAVETPKPLGRPSRPLPEVSTPKSVKESPRPSPKPETPRTPKPSSRPLPPPPSEEPRSLPGVKSPPAVTSRSTVTSPSNKSGNEVAGLLHEFFGSEQPRKPYKVDTAELLMNRPKVGGKIQTTGFEMFQIFGDGKKVPVAAHNERVLFEQEMYICPHSFINDAGWKRSEVYFWIGDEVPESTVDDAHVFILREVKAIGGTMIKIRQGKETSEFLQALGGVVITRRGSSSKYDSLAPNVLCGRRYLGQVAFDEVDFTPASFCAGFPYLITKSGKCYLWKGKGSDVDELSCARLIGMDLTLTGELIEVDDGNEPASFWELFEGGSKSKPHSADHWRLKPNYTKYCSRLFCSNADTRRQVPFSLQLPTFAAALLTNVTPPRQISEVSPFNQADLSPSNIYILDAFFEMYIIVGANAQHQYASFRNALDFAQEYAILASGMEDRPFVPISTIVLEGIPRDLKRVFRKWRDSISPTATNPNAAGLKRGRSLRVVSLTQALQALSE